MPTRFQGVRRWLTVAALLALLVWASVGAQVSPTALLDLGNTFSFLKENWWPPDGSVLPEAIRNSILTLQVAFVGTTFGLLLAMPLAFISARTTPLPGVLTALLRTLLSFLRAVPEIVWGLLLVVTIGLGPFAGVLAIMLHNIGVLGKLIAELIEASDRDPQEAIKATGGNRLHVLFLAILPDIWPNVLSQYFYRTEVAVRTSLVLGFIGAGGLGNQLFIDFKVFDYAAVSTEVLVIMVLVILIDTLGGYVRKKMI